MELAALEEGVDDVLDGGQKIKNSKPDLKNWVTKNEDLGVKKYGCFLTDYLDYDLALKVEHLNVFLRSVEKTDLFIDRQDFKNTIDFLEVFNELYWVQDILSVRIDKV